MLSILLSGVLFNVSFQHAKLPLYVLNSISLIDEIQKVICIINAEQLEKCITQCGILQQAG